MKKVHTISGSLLATYTVEVCLAVKFTHSVMYYFVLGYVSSYVYVRVLWFGHSCVTSSYVIHGYKSAMCELNNQSLILLKLWDGAAAQRAFIACTTHNSRLLWTVIFHNTCHGEKLYSNLAVCPFCTVTWGVVSA